MDYTQQELNEALFKTGPMGLIKGVFDRDNYTSEIRHYAEKFLKVLGKEGITLDPYNFLRLYGERVAYANEQIVPLKGKKEQLEYVLKKIIEKRRELNYPDEVYELPVHADNVDGYFDSETRRWVYPEDFVQANKSAYDFGEFLENVDEPIKESESPIVQTLINLDGLPEYDPEGELKQTQYEDELRQTQIKSKLLEELEHTTIYNGKKWGLIPTTEVVMNPGYEEFFHGYDNLGSYNKKETYKALKDLEKDSVAGIKLKLRALRKDFEKNEGISKRRRVGIALGGILLGSAAVACVANQIQPKIKNIKWEPTKIKNDKIYEGKVSFEAEGSKFLFYKNQISNATLELIPLNYSNMPHEAFQKEPIKSFNLHPSDGLFNEHIEEFSFNINDIKGGREYKINILITDKGGNKKSETIKTPYIREFENIAPLDSIIVGAFYYPWYGPSHNQHWGDGYTGNPTLGEYYSGNKIVGCKHIDWATGYGIDAFVISWWGQGSQEDSNIKSFLRTPLVDHIKLCILYESHGLLEQTHEIEPWPVIDMSDSKNIDRIISDFKYFAKDYFKLSNYLKIRESPVVFMYDSGAYIGNVNRTYGLLREKMRDLGIDIYLMGDVAHGGRTPSAADNLAGEGYRFSLIDIHDGISTYTPHWGLNSSDLFHPKFENVTERLYAEWHAYLEKNGKDFIPTVIPGFVPSAFWAHGPSLERNVTAFGAQVEIAQNYMQGADMFLICSWNEFHEGTNIEPTKEDGFGFLESLKEALFKP